MFTARDLAERYSVTLKTLYIWRRKRILPEAINLNGTLRWREEDIEAFEGYLTDRVAWKDAGLNPDGPTGPDAPVYSTGCETFDPRKQAAQERELKRQQRLNKTAVPTHKAEQEAQK